MWDVTQATLIARIVYAAPAWWGFLSVVELKKDRIESVATLFLTSHLPVPTRKH